MLLSLARAHYSPISSMSILPGFYLFLPFTHSSKFIIFSLQLPQNYKVTHIQFIKYRNCSFLVSILGDLSLQHKMGCSSLFDETLLSDAKTPFPPTSPLSSHCPLLQFPVSQCGLFDLFSCHFSPHSCPPEIISCKLVALNTISTWLPSW